MTHPLYPPLVAAAGRAALLVAGVRPERFGDPTPCGDWDVRALLNHYVLWTAHSFERRALRQEVPAELLERDFVAEPGWADAYAVQLDKAVAAWSDPAVWEGDIPMGGSGMPAASIAGLVLLELVLHGWDLAKATGQDPTWPEDVAVAVAGIVAENAELYRQYEGFGALVSPPGSPSTLERALAESGRDPGWTA
ncbi:TIGR03086 family metal-binding protein [Longispora sp. K20-0274]|uniref:TIGR03086 family metal-binding protein n=1 Tax=Longispora sp. K20-0274 TaxID=3088255 RepID=UPI00399B21AB